MKLYKGVEITICAAAVKISVERAMDKYWKDVNQIGEWYFVQKKSARLLVKSKVIDRMKAEKSKFRFMSS